ncbi:hypothetical protein FDP41_011976 [Naegleria fowleri]|uniref:CENP-V/GFA domain-containing protein n=1 Tax=Naegleria fowleri TaxID=5763 RepID=A0A6A5C9S5_NAEFO|nr:uncharacterized protein FDP41_011976 [Naegleria fowleri]KAF0982115.1 hypothetical protein FDP41_011976 [Naegleria fowleri]CAG4707979.1 unnamed protein product [Naegleria fowleri]
MSTENTATTCSNTVQRTGSCRCGQLRFSVKGNTRLYCGLCHCRNCRLATSAPVALVIGISKDNFEWTHGKDTVLKTVKISDRMEGYYCGQCGGYMAQGMPEYPVIGTLGCVYDDMKQEFCPRDMLQSDEDVKQFFSPTAHVNYENRVIDIPDQLPKYMDFQKPIGSGRLYQEQ